jgi:hypothetical protein
LHWSTAKNWIPQAGVYSVHTGLGPRLETIFTDRIVKDTKKRNEKIMEAIESHGYQQREIADYLGMHFSSTSRILRTREAMTKKIDLTLLFVILL